MYECDKCEVNTNKVYPFEEVKLCEVCFLDIPKGIRNMSDKQLGTTAINDTPFPRKVKHVKNGNNTSKSNEVLKMYRYVFYFTNGNVLTVEVENRRHIPSIQNRSGVFQYTDDSGVEHNIMLHNVDEVTEQKLKGDT